MQVLKSLENSFNEQAVKVKLELFVFPLIIVSLILYIFKFEEDKSSLKKRDTVYNFDFIEKKVMKEKPLDILRDIEEFLVTKKIKVNTISSSNHTIKLNVETSIKRQIELLKFLEDYNNFSKILTLNQDKNSLDIELSFKSFYIKSKLDLNERLDKLKRRKKIALKLYAVIDKKALINERWLKVGDSLNELELIKIEDNAVYLKDEYEVEKLQIYKNNDT